MKLKQALRDPRAIEGGVWVKPSQEHPEFRVRCVVRGPQYQRRFAALEAGWAREYGANGPPNDIEQRARADLLFEECIFAIEGADDFTLEDARFHSGTFAGQPLYLMMLNAVAMADARRAIDSDAAVGNSAPPSPAS
jgi:hypothetical protein